jgi:MBG domain
MHKLMQKHFPSITLNFLFAVCILATPAHAQISASVTLSDLLQTYNGSTRAAAVITIPSDLTTQVTYQDLNPSSSPPTSEVVYDDTPPILELSYLSYGYDAQKLSALGNYIQLAGTSRELESCEVVLVTYAKADSWPTLKAENSLGYYHPITISIYEVTPNGGLIFRTEATQLNLIPWRPLTQSNGEPWPFNGLAFRARVDFPAHFILPEKSFVAVNFNTQSSGAAPIGISGPYNALNVGLVNAENTPLVGIDNEPASFFILSKGSWSKTEGTRNLSVPLIRMKASSTETTVPPTNAGTWLATAAISNADYTGSDQKTLMIQPAEASIELGELSYTYNTRPVELAVTTRPSGLPVSLEFDDQTVAPTNAGSYRVTAQITDPNYSGTNSGTLNIAKASAIVAQSNLVQIADGRPKPITVRTSPINLTVTTTYTDASTDSLIPPTALGKYAVTTIITDPNYSGLASGELWLGQNMQSWINRWLDNRSIPENEQGDNDDPDQDDISNLLEYAFGLDPSKPELRNDLPPVEFQDGKLSFCYLKNLVATDLGYEVQSSTGLNTLETWNRAVTTETVIKTEGSVQTVRVTVETLDSDRNQFTRMKITRANR